jgi:hypothetical protein
MFPVNRQYGMYGPPPYEELLDVADRRMYLSKREFYGLYRQTADPIVPETVTVR